MTLIVNVGDRLSKRAESAQTDERIQDQDYLNGSTQGAEHGERGHPKVRILESHQQYVISGGPQAPAASHQA